MRKLIAALLIFLLSPILFIHVTAYSRLGEGNLKYWVFFTDKDGVCFDPYSFFDQRAIDRRLKLGLCLYDTLNHPVRNDYIEIISEYVDSLDVVSRWFNAVHVHASPSGINAILEELDFVRSVQPAVVRLVPAVYYQETDYSSMLHRVDTSLLAAQVIHMRGDVFHEHGLDGKGVRIAVFDAGFRGVNTHPAFRHIKNDNRIKATYDFHRQRENVYVSSAHGTMVLSAVAGIIDGVPMGLATGAEFLLARTEIRREPLAEEKYWLAAVEWADRMGADIINSSLGYVFHRYFPEEMDGQTSLVARAARIAARKGILVVNSAGNQGNDPHWRIVVTPADVDSVLTVGALEYPSMLRAAYSSVGPTANGQMKPNVSAIGNIVAAGRRNLTTPQGTSFSSPLITGFAACLWQRYPNWSNMQVFDAIQKSATLYPYYDYAHGYGTPQASHFFPNHHNIQMPTFDIIHKNDSIHLVFRKIIKSTNVNDNKENISLKKNYLYYQKRNPDQSIARYFVIDMEDADVFSLPLSEFVSGQQLLLHYNGYTSGFNVP